MAKPRGTKRHGRPSELPGALPDQEDEAEFMDTDVESCQHDEATQIASVSRPEQPTRTKKREIADIESVVDDGGVGRPAPRPTKKNRPRSPENTKRMPSILDRPAKFQRVPPIQPAPGGEERKPGEEWTNDAGDRFKIDQDGSARRLVEVKEWRRKQPKMVRGHRVHLHVHSLTFLLFCSHVVGPTMIRTLGKESVFLSLPSCWPVSLCVPLQVVVEKWLTKEEFEQAQTENLLAGQSDPEDVAEPGTPMSRGNSVFYEQGTGTPLGARSRSTSVRAKSPLSQQQQQGGRLRIASGQNTKPVRNLVGLPRQATALERRDMELLTPKRRQSSLSIASAPAGSPANAAMASPGVSPVIGGESTTSTPTFNLSAAPTPTSTPSFSLAPKVEGTEPTKPSFSFSKPTSQQQAASSAAAATTTPSFSLGQPAATPAASASNPFAGIGVSGPSTTPSFGGGTLQPQTQTSSGGFSFGKQTAAGSAPPPPQPAAAGGFSFGKPATTMGAPPPAPSGGFSFNAPSTPAPTSAPAAPASTFNFAATTPSGTGPSQLQPQPSFSFGAPAQPSASSGFQFGAAPPAALAADAGSSGTDAAPKRSSESSFSIPTRLDGLANVKCRDSSSPTT
jgi:hypothetical protein